MGSYKMPNLRVMDKRHKNCSNLAAKADLNNHLICRKACSYWFLFYIYVKCYNVFIR